MPFDPDRPEKRMGAHVYHVEGGVDLTAWGFPGLTFEGDVDIEIDVEGGWYVEAVHALDAKGYTHHYATNEGVGYAVINALYLDTFHAELIENACWYHGDY